MPGSSFTGSLPPATPAQLSLADELKGHVGALATDIGHRDVEHPENLTKASDYIQAQFERSALKVTRYPYEVAGQTVHNLEATIAGTTDQIVLIGAHYDSVRGSPGANDNASGVAAMLALAKRFAAREQRPKKTLRFVAFVNEEPPYFQTREMGSLVYAKMAKARGDQIVAMLSLETIGCYSDEKGSQHYPAPFSMFYPNQGNFIAFVGNTESGDLVREIVRRFRNQVDFPSEGAALLGAIEGIGWSDHWSFWQMGYKALMVTDTAPFRYQHYHTIQDTPDKINYERTARVVEGLYKVVAAMADE